MHLLRSRRFGAIVPFSDTLKHGHAKAVALLALGVMGDPRRLAELADHAAAYERDAPKMWKVPRRAIRDIATLGTVVQGAPSSVADKVKPDVAALQDAWSKLFLWDVIARGFERDGRNDVAATARTRTAVLNESRRAA